MLGGVALLLLGHEARNTKSGTHRTFIHSIVSGNKDSLQQNQNMLNIREGHTKIELTPRKGEINT